MLGELDQSQTRKTSILLGIPTDFVRKDYFVTNAIRILTSINDEYFKLVFQGGTSLSKGYRIISRLSEDVDFRVIHRPTALSLGKDVRRKKLRDFRYALVNSLKNADFIVPEEAINVFYEGRFMSIQAQFPESERISYLKPHIAIDCFLGELALEPQEKSITTLIKTSLGDECTHSSFSIDCVALDETAAEKWVALTRRIANTKLKNRKSDKDLVRHIYDLYHLKTAGLLTGEYASIVNNIIEKDKKQFKNHNSNYTNDPVRESELALDMLFEDTKWRDHWDYFLEQMVYEKSKPSFEKAYGELQLLSKNIFSHLIEK